MGEIREPPMWDLSPLVESEDPERVKQSIEESLRKAERFEEKYKDRVKKLSSLEFFDFYKAWDDVLTTWMNHFRYAWLRQCQDVTDNIALELYEHVMKRDAEIRSRLVFAEIEVGQTLAERPELVQDPALKEYRHTLEKSLEKSRYLLSESDELLIVNKDFYGVDSWSQLHTQLKSSRQFKVVIDGEKKSMGFTELRNIAEGSPDRLLRKAATEAFYDGLSNDKLIYATALKSVFGNYLSQVKMRGYPSVLTKTLIDESISQTTLDSLISTIRKKTGLIRRYLELRAKIMGLPKLTGYDVYAPIFEDQSNISLSETKRLLIESYTEFDKEAGDFITSLFENNRIDLGVRPGKFGQAFCSSFSDLRTSYVLVARIGNTAAISGLAHECGHALHSYYASEKHRWINQIMGGCIAETGSVFGQILVIDKMLEESESEEARLLVLDNVLNGLYILVYFILNCYLFEKRVFIALENDEPIDSETLDSIWITARTEIFGESVDWLPGMEEWMVPGQFFWPREKFYNFPYAFAQLLVFVLYRLYKEEGESFVPKMKRILSAGGSKSPKTLIAEVGLDITSPKFWEIGFKQAEMYLDEFEQLVNKLT